MNRRLAIALVGHAMFLCASVAVAAPWPGPRGDGRDGAPRPPGLMAREIRGKTVYQPLKRGWQHVDFSEGARLSFDSETVRSGRLTAEKRRSFSEGASKSVIGLNISMEPREASTREFPAPRQRMEMNGAVYHFEPEGLEFEKPALLTLPYSTCDGISDEDINVYYYNKRTRYWEIVSAVYRDTANKTISACISHFSDYVAGSSSFLVDESGTLGGGNVVQDVDPNTGSLILKTVEFDIPARGLHLALKARFSSDYLYRKHFPAYSPERSAGKVFVPEPNGNYPVPQTDISAGWTYELPYCQFGSNNQLTATLPNGRKIQLDSVMADAGSLKNGRMRDTQECRILRSYDGSKLWFLCPEAKVSLEASCSISHYSYYVETGPSSGYEVSGYNTKVNGVVMHFEDGSYATFQSSGLIDKMFDASGKNSVSFHFEGGALRMLTHNDGRSVKIFSSTYASGKKAIVYVLSDSSSLTTLGAKDEFLARRILNASDGRTESFSRLTTKDHGSSSSWTPIGSTNESSYYSVAKTTAYGYSTSSSIDGNTVVVTDPGSGSRTYSFAKSFYHYASFYDTYECSCSEASWRSYEDATYYYYKPKVAEAIVKLDASSAIGQKKEYSYLTSTSIPSGNMRKTGGRPSEATYYFMLSGVVYENYPIVPSTSTILVKAISGNESSSQSKECIEYEYDDCKTYKGVVKKTNYSFPGSSPSFVSATSYVLSQLPATACGIVFNGYYVTKETNYRGSETVPRWNVSKRYDCLGRLLGQVDDRIDAGSDAMTIEYVVASNDGGPSVYQNFGLVKKTGILKKSGIFTTEYTYDSAMNVIARKTNATAMGETTSYVYDASTNNLLTITYPEGNMLNISYGNGYLSSYIVLDRQKLGKNINGTSDEFLVHSYDYDIRGRTTSVTSKIVSSAGADIVHTGFPITELRYGYDGCDRVTEKARKTANGTIVVFRRSFVGAGNNLVVTTTDAKGYMTVDSYDSFYRKYESMSYRPDTISRNAGYEGQGRIAISRSSWKYDEKYPANVMEERVYDNKEHTLFHTKYYVYDEQGRMKREYADNQSGSSMLLREMSYIFTDSGEEITEKLYRDVSNYAVSKTLSDWFGRLSLMTKYGGLMGTGTALSTRCEHDYTGEVTKRVLPNGEEYAYSYGKSGLLDRVVYPDGKTHETNSYDRNGRMIKSIDASGNTKEMTYNDAGQIISLKASNTGKKAITIRTNYCQFGPREIAQEYDGVPSEYLKTRYGYDPDGRIVEESRDFASIEGSIQNITKYRVYDDAGNISALKVSHGSTFAKEFFYSLPCFGGDLGVNPSTSLSVDGIVIGKYSSTYGGAIDQIKYGSGKTSSFGGYDSLMRPGKITNPDSLGCQSYTYDFQGNILAWNKNAYSYDGIDRIQKENNAIYDYDTIGNIISAPGGAKYSYEQRSSKPTMRLKTSQINAGPVTNYIDDGSTGNMISVSSRFTNIAYDALNRMVSITDIGRASSALSDRYSYDPSGVRYKKIEESSDGISVETYYVYEGNSILCEFSKKGSSWVRRINAFLGGMAFAQVVVRDGASAVSYLYLDHLGSVRVVANSAGDRLATIDYTCWGLPSVDSVGAYDGKSDILFTGKRMDATGLYYFNARYYDPSVGRFFSEDQAKDGMNWYVFCNNNPVRFTDPTGRFPIDEVVLMVERASVGDMQAAKMAASYMKESSSFGRASVEERIAYTAERHLGEKYERGKNDCDIWCEKVVNEAGCDLPEGWNDASSNNCNDHVSSIRPSDVTVPGDGVYLAIIQGKIESHCQLLIVNDDDSVSVFQQGHLAYESDKYSYQSISEYESYESNNGEWYSTYNYYSICDGDWYENEY